MMLGFGLDLAGYTTGRTAFAAAEHHDGDAEVVIFKDSVFSQNRKWKSGDRLSAILAVEVETMARCLRLGPVAVDVPIDLQNLLKPQTATHIWELTNRPIDKALRALPPLA